METYKTLEIIQNKEDSSVFHLLLNRPSKRNALSPELFSEFPRALSSLDHNPNVNVVVLSGAGDNFCGGIDLSELKASERFLSGDRGRGGGEDPTTHQGFCTKDAYFSVKEVDLAIVADLGTLQRLPSIVGYGNAVELALTGRRFSGPEAKQLGLVSKVFNSKQELEEGVRMVAEGIASKSPLAVTGTKAVLLKSRDLNLEQGLDYVATWNSSMMLSGDLKEAISAQFQKRKPKFAKL
uniref:Enoyl-CoA hydratase n=1 Tax=Cannabis sativa TaxID=3483 RepID=A0A803PC34_CANSA